MSRFVILSLHFLVALAVLTTSVYADTGNKDACDEWANIALKVTGSGKLHKCAARTPDCNGMDCSGSTVFSHDKYPAFIQHDIDLSYCFGIEINSCNDPFSMDFYLQLPSRNLSKVYRIMNDDVIELKELNFSLGPLGTTYPSFNFQFEREDTKSVNLSVTARLKSSSPLADIVLEGFHFTLINDQVIPVKPCGKKTHDSSKTPPATFAPDKCQLKPLIPAATLSPSVTDKPSDTLNKPCGLEQPCGAREMCKIGASVPICICGPEFSLSLNGHSCMTSSRVNNSCSLNDECGPNEECKEAAPSKATTCQCKQHYHYNSLREICVIPGHTTEHPVNNQTQSTTTESHMTGSHASGSQTTQGHMTGSHASGSQTTQGHMTGSHASGSQTTQSHRAEPVKAKASSNKHNIAMFVGGGLAIVVVIGLVISGVVCYMRRRRQRPLSINDRESSAPLTGNDDSDDNMVM